MKNDRRARLLTTVILLAAGVGAFVFRAPQLERRPMHTDEAVHAVKTGLLLDEGVYTYNPYEYHGPTLYYFSLPVIALSGADSFREIASEVPLRLVPMLFGTGLVFLFLLIRDGLGRRAVVCAALLSAVSPAMVFYSRYYIQEMLLVFFTFAAIVAGWRYTRAKRFPWALAAGVCLGLMHATKETSVIAYGSLLGAAGLTLAWTRWVDRRLLRVGDYIHHWHAAGAIKVAVVVALFVLTAFLSNPAATVDAVRTYGFYLGRAGTGDSSTLGPALHLHPWHYYLRMLLFFRSGPGPFWSEGFILLLAALGFVLALRRKRPEGQGNVYLHRFLAFYALLMTLVYSLIPYKTPWCLLGFLHGMILLGGIGASALYEELRGRWLKGLAGALFALGVAHLAVQAYRGSYVYPADTRNPYVYGHTSPDLLNLVGRVEDLSRLHPDGEGMVVKVMAPQSDYWPLPWYLRRLPNVGFWDSVPAEPEAPILVARPALEAELDARLTRPYQKEYIGLRPEVLLVAYIEEPLWERFIEQRSTLSLPESAGGP